MAVIVLNIIQMGITFESEPPMYTFFLEISNYIFTAIFTLEMLIKMQAFSYRYFETSWNKFDFAIVIASWLDIALIFVPTDGNETLLVLPQIATQFSELKAEYEKVISVDVTSAVELTAEQQTTLSAALEKRLARKVKLNCMVDANVVSGLVIKAGDMVIDGSVRGKLSRLATTIQS